MNKIRILPEDVVNKIAAGEVIERPASVVKELVENSLDAGALRINVEFDGAGKNLIRVSDNGCGMSREDALASIKRHATSKITSFSDMRSIRTLGFRGEALPSICAVSRFRMVTKTAEAPTATELTVDGEKALYAKESAGTTGTIIEAADLFFNLPARKKFLKGDSTEQSHIVRTLEECALAHPETGFTVVGNKKIIFNSPPCSKLEERAADIIGANLVSGMVSINSEAGGIKITGLISSIEKSQPNKNLQYFFINSRPVMNRLLSQAVYDAYRDSLPIGRHPAVILLLNIDPQFIDINVHPTKKIVKFSNDFEIYTPLNAAICEAISRKKIAWGQNATTANATPPESAGSGWEAAGQGIEAMSVPDYIREKPTRQFQASVQTESAQTPPYRIIGQLHNTYILAESPDGLLLFDQHAAEERVLYEKFLAASKNAGSPSVQELLIPLTVDLAPHEAEALKPHIDEINKLGFEMSGFGGNSMVFKALPYFIGGIKRINDFFREFAAIMIENFSDKSLNLQPLEKIIRAACRAAVKASDRLSFEEMDALVTGLMNCSQPNCCPHGRPTIIKLTVNELQKKFLRK